MTSLTDPAFGALCALGSALTWAVTSLLVRVLASRMNSITINAVRSTLGGLALLAWLALTGRVGALGVVSARALGLLILSIVVAIAIGDTVFFESTRSLGLTRALTVSMTYPVIAALLAAAFLGEPLTLRLALGTSLTLGGLVLIVGERAGTPVPRGHVRLGMAAAGLASVAWAVSVIFLKSPLAEVDPVSAQAIRLPVAGALLFATPWAWGAGRALSRGGGATMGLVAALSGLTAVSSVMFVAGLKYAGVTVATVLSSTAPMFAMPLQALVLGERVGRRVIAGTVVAVAGIALLQG